MDSGPSNGCTLTFICPAGTASRTRISGARGYYTKMANTPLPLKALEETERKGIPGLVEVLQAEGLEAQPP